jgi:hypothetical protein
MQGDGADSGSLQRQIDYYKQKQRRAREIEAEVAGYQKQKVDAAAETRAQKNAGRIEMRPVMQYDKWHRPIGTKMVPMEMTPGGAGTPVAQKPNKKPQSPFPPGYSVALPPGMQGTQWERLADGSYAPAGSGKWQTPRKAPRVINWGAMTPDQIASTPSPYLGGRIPTVKTY